MLPLLLLSPALAADLLVAPYLGIQGDTLLLQWEADSASSSVLEWTCGSDGGTATPSWAETSEGTFLAQVRLEGLEPGAACTWRLDALEGEFRAPPARGADVRLVLLSDTQGDWTHPDMLREVTEDGILAVPGDLPAAVLIAGDLVNDGWDPAQWTAQLFPGVATLAASVPLLPVLGNHDANSDLFHAYFPLPPHPDPLYDGHHYVQDVGRVRVIGMDTSFLYLAPAALEWLDGVLQEAGEREDLAFVLLQGHHPYHSELWPPGESASILEILHRLDAFAATYDKPALHVFGHTHGWSRGQSLDAPVLQVNAATAWGNPDTWGEYDQVDYPEFTVSHDDWGFAIVEVSGDTLTLTRYSRGGESTPMDNEVRDAVVLRRGNTGPATPQVRSPQGEVSPLCVPLVASPFCDTDGDLVGHARWQVAPTCQDLDTPTWDALVPHENWYFGVDTQAGDHLSDAVVPELSPSSSWCVRVRYRDRSLAWSDWSEPVPFTTGTGDLTENLLQNPGAEEGTLGWTVTEGVLESVADGECDAVAPHGGDRAFSVGGVCDPTPSGGAYQDVDLTPWSASIDAGTAALRLQAWLRNWEGADLPTVRARVLDGAGQVLAESDTLEEVSGEWTWNQASLALPAGSRTVRVVLGGTREEGEDNDAYVDDLDLRLSPQGDLLRCLAPPPYPYGDEPCSQDGVQEGEEDRTCGCGVRPGPGSAWGFLGILVVGWRRRKRG